MNQMCDHLFVYGFLRKDAPHEMSRFLNMNAQYLGSGYFHGQLYDTGTYPAAIKDDRKNNRVFGDIYRLNDTTILKKLDEFEEVGPGFQEPNEYRRVEIPVVMNERKLTCWVYLYNWPVTSLKKIESGDYLKHIQHH